ncbi:hypothetical protein KL930_003927 [Ogataea haglerorum]|uniref:Succinate dehydrogenase assembly factor 3 n=1 Tax=Ogataea haglerorum TaxID=1937702 RepID=A0ABQ7RCX7_9ASCO|nr:hypothetical protein KL951_003634 [Ogataea haglerorum]KAG7705057.1 hypothetical protein KL914_003743 [Ogataea haglerorum]KAG7716817.1 hypothetical protein KL913_003333 [Ogataea haglerorum]KAG7729629.1 hypothetical protein KL948_003783 [Ogataea haglerorum]KAG7736921.1 hypothetical protein KL923_004059 [Ogataea haglerorum]
MRTTVPRLVRPRRPARDTRPLLPPLTLYRAILRSHRKLPPDARHLGDNYVRAEFRAHANVEDPLQIVGFLTAWQDYLQAVTKNTEDDWRKYKLTSDALSKMSDEQVVQLYELMQEARNVHGEDE